MNKINIKTKAIFSIAISIMMLLTSCNKELEQFAPLSTPVYPTGTNMAAAIAATPTDSLFNRMLLKSGMAPTLADTTKTYTLFVPDNNGMKVFINAISGGAVPLASPDAVFSGFITANIPAATAAGIIQYNLIGTKYPSASFGSSFPNYPLPSQIILDPTQPFVRMPIFPVKSSPFSYVNNIPLIAVDQNVSNGVIHHTYTVVAPPTATLKSMIAAEPTLSYFRAAIARGDSGAVGLSKIDSLLGYGVTNMTILAPNDAAMQPVLAGAIYQGVYPVVYQTVYNTAYNAAIAGGATAAQATTIATSTATAQAPGIAQTQAASLASTPAGFNLLPVATVQGIVVYHVLGTGPSGSPAFQPNIRIFSNNFSTTPTLIKTLVNNGLAIHPGVLAQASFTGPAVTSLKFTGYGTIPSGGTPFSGGAANAVKMDNHAVNGVYHIIDKVLLPQ